MMMRSDSQTIPPQTVRAKVQDRPTALRLCGRIMAPGACTARIGPTAIRAAMMTAIMAAIMALAFAVPGLAQTAAPQPVAGPAELMAALRGARGGDILLLAPGDYGVLALTGGKDMPAAAGSGDVTAPPVILRAADPARPARFSGMRLRDAAGLAFQGVTFAYSFAPGDVPHRHRPFRVLQSRDITFSGVLFAGDLARGGAAHDNGYGAGHGLFVSGSRGIVLENSEFRDWHKAAIFTGSSQITVRGNDIHAIRSDGLNFSAVQSVLIEGNRIHDFNRSLASPDHADMIQIFTARTTTPTRDLVIRGNLLNAGGGKFTQSIFMRNEAVDTGFAGPEMAYRNITIENNVIINAHLHGITVGPADGLSITRNTLIRNFRARGEGRGEKLWIPQIRIAPTARNVVIRGNAAAAISGHSDQPDWTVADNVLLQTEHPGQPGYYGDIFADALAGDPRDPASFAYLPGGLLDGLRRGADLLRLPMTGAAAQGG